jgi:hypothetical protein
MNPFTGRPEWEPEPAVLPEIERSTQEVERRESRNPIVRFCGLCLILGLLGVGVLSLSSPPVVNSGPAQPGVSVPPMLTGPPTARGVPIPRALAPSLTAK